MMNSTSSDAPEHFRRFSDEYAKAVEALRALETQADVLVAGGAKEQLKDFLARFTNMADEAVRRARDQRLEHFGEWFQELADKARALEETLFNNNAYGAGS